MTAAHGIRQVGYFDCPGDGQVVVSGTTTYVAHTKSPHGTTIVDVSDPARPRKLPELSTPARVHSHKIRAGFMLKIGGIKTTIPDDKLVTNDFLPK